MRWREIPQRYRDLLEAQGAKSPAELLGVAPGCDRRALRAAYLELAKRYHPDHSDKFLARYNEEVLKLINSAYQTLLKGDHG
jgi:molecular chaperone DnaJ